MALEIKHMLDAVAGVRKDWKEDWKEDAKSDWKFDFDATPGDAIGVIPANTVLPAVTGTLLVGQTLSCTTGTWTGNAAPTFTYQWKSNNINVVGATSSTFVLRAADTGLTIKCVVTGTNAVGAVAAISNTTGAITAAPINTVLPVISGTLTQGSTLSVTTGTWTGYPTPTYAYQWKSNGTNVGTNANTYVLVSGDATHTITCAVTATNSVAAVVATSAATAAIT